jgi:DNA-directed RNA polymerase subunit H (RpoH/RPB5)
MLLSLNNPEISERLQPDDWNLPRIKESDAIVAYLMLAFGVIFIALDGN